MPGKMQKPKKTQVKTVMFVPFTPGSELAKRLRQAEEKIEDMAGYRLKIVERAGIKLQDALTKADPWQGQNCNREGCLLCLTKIETGKNKTQDCTRRSLVYETWCMTCYTKDLEAAQLEAGDNSEKLKKLTDKIKVYKYIGESARSVYERSWEHLNDFQNLSTKSHLLKHAVELHLDEDLSKLQFGIKVLKYTKSAFERQICESVTIEANRNHHLLNSRSEFNPSAVPRLTCNLGDKNFKKYEKEVEKDMEKEEGQIQKIRDLIKERNKTRAQNQRKLPPPKRRKIAEGKFATGQDSREQAQHERMTGEEGDKRKQEEEQDVHQPPAKKRNSRPDQDIREALKKTARKEKQEEDKSQEEEHQLEQEQEEDRPARSQQEGREWVNWEQIFRDHLEETKMLNKEREERIESKQRKEKSWELL